MAKVFADRCSDLAFLILRPAIEAWMRYVARREAVAGPGVDFRRRTPFLLLANHSFALDVVHVPLPFRVTPQIVASRDMFVRPFERFALTYIARCIMTTKGGGDVRTVTELMRAVAAGYPVLLFPEGDVSFFGRSREIPKSVAMLARKLGLDVITCRVSGGYLSAPRWARAKRGNRSIELRYELALSAEQVSSLSLGEINRAISGRLEHDEYAYQRRAMIARPSARAAEGLEDVLYACPACRAIATMKAEEDRLWCGSCGASGRVDEYGFIRGLAYEDPAAWDDFQRGLAAELRASSFSSSGELFINDYRLLTQARVGAVEVEHRDGALRLSGAMDRAFPVAELRDVVLTMRSTLNFSHDGADYILKLDSLAMAFLRACQDRY